MNLVAISLLATLVHGGLACARPTETSLTLVRPADGSDDDLLRVIDARDLAALLPGDTAARSRQPVGTVLVSNGTGFATPGSPFVTPEEPNRPAQESAIDRLFGQLCLALSVDHTRLGEAMYLVKGPKERQDELRKLLESVRQTYAVSCGIELLVVAVPAAQSPQVGAAFTPAPTDRNLYRVTATAPARVETRLSCTSSTAYIYDWTPVVADHSVGYDPQPAFMEKGLNVRVIVLPASDGTASVKLSGTVSDLEVPQFRAPLVIGTAAVEQLAIGLPVLQLRDITATVATAAGKPVVAAVMSGFKDGESLVVVAAVK